MQRAWKIAGGVFVVVFAVWAQQSWQLSLSDTLGPGPGFFPFWLSISGIALSIVLIAQAHSGSVGENDAGWTLIPRGPALARLLTMLAALVAVTALLDVLGYRIAVAIFCTFLLRVLGARSWWIIITFALAASFGVHALFSDLLKVPLPVGLFDF